MRLVTTVMLRSINKHFNFWPILNTTAWCILRISYLSLLDQLDELSVVTLLVQRTSSCLLLLLFNQFTTRWRFIWAFQRSVLRSGYAISCFSGCMFFIIAWSSLRGIQYIGQLFVKMYKCLLKNVTYIMRKIFHSTHVEYSCWINTTYFGTGSGWVDQPLVKECLFAFQNPQQCSDQLQFL